MIRATCACSDAPLETSLRMRRYLLIENLAKKFEKNSDKQKVEAF